MDTAGLRNKRMKLARRSADADIKSSRSQLIRGVFGRLDAVSELEAYITTMPQMEAAIRRLAARIGAPDRDLPTFTMYVGDGTPHVDLQSDGFNWVVSERGEEYERVVTRDANEILWLVFKGAAFSMAVDYALAHGGPGVDARRLIFQRGLQLLGELSPAWARVVSRSSRPPQAAPLSRRPAGQQARQPDSPERPNEA